MRLFPKDMVMVMQQMLNGEPHVIFEPHSNSVRKHFTKCAFLTLYIPTDTIFSRLELFYVLEFFFLFFSVVFPVQNSFLNFEPNRLTWTFYHFYFRPS